MTTIASRVRFTSRTPFMTIAALTGATIASAGAIAGASATRPRSVSGSRRGGGGACTGTRSHLAGAAASVAAQIMSTIDWIAVGVIALAALAGLRRGLVGSVFSAGGIIAGALFGARVGPHLLHGGARSPYTPFAGLVGALLGAFLLETAASVAGSLVRGSLRLTPLRFVDSLGGLVAGAVAGLALVWVGGAAALLAPGQTGLRQAVQGSEVVRRLNDVVPPRRLLNVLARIDPLPALAGPAAPVGPPDPSVTRDPVVRRAGASVVRVLGTACGLGVEGSGWVARPHLVVTAAHVVAGQRDTAVQVDGVGASLRATAVAFDPKNDVAILRVPDLGARALRIAEPRPGASIAIVGYPENGPLQATPGRIGRTAFSLGQDAYGRGPVSRQITSVRGRVRHGDSGGPAIDRRGAVQTTVFAARVGSAAGFGVPTAVVRRALAGARREVSTGGCAD